MSAPDSPVTEKPLSTANDGTEARRRLRLGEVLVKEGLVTKAQIETALAT